MHALYKKSAMFGCFFSFLYSVFLYKFHDTLSFHILKKLLQRLSNLEKQTADRTTDSVTKIVDLISPLYNHNTSQYFIYIEFPFRLFSNDD